MIAPIIGMLQNMKEKKWHPIYFLVNPRPSQEMDDPAMRYKSKAHHTAGFATREEAVSVGVPMLVDYVKKTFDTDALLCLEKDFPWDGEGVPALVVHFMEQDGKIVPAF